MSGVEADAATTPEVVTQGRPVRGESPLHASGAAYQDRIVSWAGDVLRVDGEGDSRYSYLAVWPARAVRPLAALLVRGVLHEGGLTIGLRQGDEWHTQRNVTSAALSSTRYP